MKLSRLFAVLLPLFLTACGLTDQQKADYAKVRTSGVSSAVYDKMTHGDDLSLYDIKSLSHAGVNDGIILRYLRDHHTTYFLNSDDVTGLRKAGVSQSIVDYMLQSPRAYGSDLYPVVGLDIGYGPYWGDPFWGSLSVSLLSLPPALAVRLRLPYASAALLMNYQLDQKSCLVTGSTAGIGFAIAAALAGEGAKVIINGRHR